MSHLSLMSVSVMASLMSSQSFSRELSVFWTVWLIVFSMVRHTSSIWFTQRLGWGQEHKTKTWNYTQREQVKGTEVRAQKVSNHLELNGSGTPHLILIRNVNGGHVKTTFVESWSLAELLDDLHHYSLGQPVTKKTKKYVRGRERKDVTSCFKVSKVK